MAWTEGSIFMCSQVNGLYWLKQASPVLSRSANLQTKKLRSYLQTKKIRSFPCHYSFKGNLSRVIRASLFICVPEITWYPWHPSWAGFDPWDEESRPCNLRSSSHKKNLNFTGLWYSGFRKKKSKPIQNEKKINKTTIKNSKFSSSQHKRGTRYFFPFHFCLWQEFQCTFVILGKTSWDPQMKETTSMWKIRLLQLFQWA